MLLNRQPEMIEFRKFWSNSDKAGRNKAAKELVSGEIEEVRGIASFGDKTGATLEEGY